MAVAKEYCGLPGGWLDMDAVTLFEPWRVAAGSKYCGARWRSSSVC